MKTKLKVDLIKNGMLTESIARMVSSHNEGLVEIDLPTICGFVLAKRAEYFESYKGHTIKADYPYIHISGDNGESVYITVMECEMEELVPEKPLHDKSAN